MYSEGKVFSTSKASPQSITKLVGFGNSTSPGAIDIRLPAKPEVTPKICSYTGSGLRRFTLPEGRNLHLEVVRFLAVVLASAVPAHEDGARWNSDRAGSGASRSASRAYLPQRYLTRKYPSTPHCCLYRGKVRLTP